jgi:hypothetical protein
LRPDFEDQGSPGARFLKGGTLREKAKAQAERNRQWVLKQTAKAIGGPRGFWGDAPKRHPVLIRAERRNVKLPGQVEFEKWQERPRERSEDPDWNAVKADQIKRNRQQLPTVLGRGSAARVKRSRRYVPFQAAPATLAQHRVLLARAVAHRETDQSYSRRRQHQSGDFSFYKSRYTALRKARIARAWTETDAHSPQVAKAERKRD